MNTVQLYTFLHDMLAEHHCHFDVIPADHLVLVPLNKFPIYIVVNNETSEQGGEHWTAFYLKSRKAPLHFFCSYGLGIKFYNVHFNNFAIRVGNNIVENTRPLQSSGTDVCGQYSLYFLYKKYCGCSNLSVYCRFSSNNKQNDIIVRNFVKHWNHLFHKDCKYKTTIQSCKCKCE